MRHTILTLISVVWFSVLATAQDVKTYDDGITRFKAKDYSGVIDVFSGMLANKDRNKRYDEDLYFYRGQANYFTGKADDGLADLDKALELNHYNKPVINWFKARCYDKKGDVREAESHYKDAVALAENNKKVLAQILADRSQFYSRQGNRMAASDDLAMAKSLDPANADLGKPAVAANRTAGEKSETQVIVKNNQRTESKPVQKSAPPAKKDPATTQPVTPIQEPVVEPKANTAMISTLAATYKDEQRFALVIGNGNYPKGMGSLKNPVNDATDVSTELKKSQFEVQLLTNATYIQMREAMRKFQEKLVNGPKDQTVGLFYYAGHGVQYQDENYLVPIDASVQFEDDIVRMCFPVQKMVLANMERSNSRMNIVILDACRNNPFPAANRAVSQGLGEMKKARGSFIAYATAPGSVASDGVGRNGLYTQELLKALRKPGLTIEQVFKDVRLNVMRLSNDKQYTWDSSNIIGDFYFKF